MIVSVRGLHFTYPGGESPVLRDLDFEIREGEIFGFLGPNGSGKTTTQKLLVRVLFGYEGQVEIFGQDLRSLGHEYYNRVGVCFEIPNLYDKLTAEENLEFYRDFFDGETDGPAELLERMNLPVGDRRRVGQFSKGMRMRLVLARSLLNRPRLWFLDEPTTGQDPRQAVLIRELIREPEAVFWVFVFPVLLALALGLAFRSRGAEELAVGVQQGPEAEWCQAVLDEAPGLRAELFDEEQARMSLRSGNVALVVVPGESWTYWFDPTRQESRLAKLAVDDVLQTAAGRQAAALVVAQDAKHHLRGDGEELAPVVIGVPLPDQLHEGFVHQGRRLEGQGVGAVTILPAEVRQRGSD